jgi:hypothetical protein
MNLANIFILLVRRCRVYQLNNTQPLHSISQYSAVRYHALLEPEPHSYSLLPPLNAAFVKIVDLNTYQRVRLDIDMISITILILVFRLSVTLVSRLVLNLREQDSIPAYLLTTIETEQRFQAGLPDGERSMTWIRSHPLVRTNNSTYEMEAVGSVAAGVSLISVKMIAEMGSEEALVGVTSMLDIGPK